MKMEKPDWKDAPEWANYLTLDEDGDWHWHEKLPTRCLAGWWVSDGLVFFAGSFHWNWRDSLEERK